MLARVLLAQDYPRPALALLDRLHAPAADLGRTGSVIENQALQALGAGGRRRPGRGGGPAGRGARPGLPQGYGRVFADEGAPMGVLLGRLAAAQKAGEAAARGVPLGCLARVLRALGQQHA